MTTNETIVVAEQGETLWSEQDAAYQDEVLTPEERRPDCAPWIPVDDTMEFSDVMIRYMRRVAQEAKPFA